ALLAEGGGDDRLDRSLLVITAGAYPHSRHRSGAGGARRPGSVPGSIPWGRPDAQPVPHVSGVLLRWSVSAGLRRGASLVLWSVVGSAAVAVVWVLPAFVQFARSAPDSFWALAVCALVVDAPLFFAFRREDPRA